MDVKHIKVWDFQNSCADEVRDHVRRFKNTLFKNFFVVLNALSYSGDFCFGNFRNLLNVRVENSITIFTQKCHFEPPPYLPTFT